MLFTGGNDWLADPTDVAELIPKIKSVIIYDKNIPQYEHLDFLWGLDAATEVYDEAIAIMKQRLWKMKVFQSDLSCVLCELVRQQDCSYNLQLFILQTIIVNGFNL